MESCPWIWNKYLENHHWNFWHINDIWCVRTAFLNWRFLVNVYDLRRSIVRAAASIDDVLNYDKQSSPIQLGGGYNLQRSCKVGEWKRGKLALRALQQEKHIHWHCLWAFSSVVLIFYQVACTILYMSINMYRSTFEIRGCNFTFKNINFFLYFISEVCIKN